jgi:hypothetical protein
VVVVAHNKIHLQAKMVVVVVEELVVAVVLVLVELAHQDKDLMVAQVKLVGHIVAVAVAVLVQLVTLLFQTLSKAVMAAQEHCLLYQAQEHFMVAVAVLVHGSIVDK